ncbi:hypothetical protein [Lentibacillus jeotgali]|nr:hypothetical protein [Lentibacillus jeotgali]
MNEKQEKGCYMYRLTQSLGLFMEGDYQKSRKTACATVYATLSGK